MIVGNLIVFVVVIVVVCIVDLSTISLDEPTERLLYYEVEQNEASAKDGTDSTEYSDSSETSSKPNEEDVNKSSEGGSGEPSEQKVSASGALEGTDSAEANNEDFMDDLSDIAEQLEMEGATDAGDTDVPKPVECAVNANSSAETPENLAYTEATENIEPTKEELESYLAKSMNLNTNAMEVAKMALSASAARVVHEPSQSMSSAAKKVAGVNTHSLDDEVGISADFADDFSDNILSEIYDKGEPS